MKATLTTLTPIHIGSGITYNKNIDFFQQGEKIGIIDEQKVLQIIGMDNIAQWTAAIEKGGDAFKNLLTNRCWKGNLQDICSRIMPLRCLQHNSTQLKEIFRTPLKGLCIPGSSLKGAIRTAIFNSFLTEDERKKITADDMKTWKVKKDFNTNKLKGNDVKWKDEKLEKRYFGNNANEKSTRFLKIGDIHIENTEDEVHELVILNKYKDHWEFKEGQQTLVEAVPAGCKAEFEFNIDTVLLNKNIEAEKNKWPENKIIYLKDCNSICKLINNFTKSLIEFNNDLIGEEEFPEIGNTMIEQYKKIYKIIKNIDTSKEFIIRIGGNCGYTFTTGQWIDYPDIKIDDDYYQIRKTIQKKDYSDMEIWPKTRKITSNGEIFGFVKITLG